jgi:FtsZ-binding cell division protein ZapB
MAEPKLQNQHGFCGSCGGSLNGERFCPECGEKTGGDVRTLPSAQRPEGWSASPPRPSTESSRNWPFIAACVVAGIVAVLAVAIFAVKSGAISRANAAIVQRNTTIASLNARIRDLNSRNATLQKENNDLSSSNQGLTNKNDTLTQAAQSCQDASQKSQDVLTGLNEYIHGVISYSQFVQLINAAGTAANTCNSYFTTTVGG